MSKTRTALVTGGNRGLGLETSRQLARHGLRVILTSRGEVQGSQAARTLAAEGLNVAYGRLDVGDPASIAALAAQLERDGERIDVLVNNAAVGLEGFNVEVAKKTLEVNYFGTKQTTDGLLPHLSDGGQIVMVSSGMGELGALGAPLRRKFLSPGLSRADLDGLMQKFVSDVEAKRHKVEGWPSSAYRVSKAGLNALVRILAQELAERHIAVNAVCPGWVRTDMGGPHATRGVAEGAASIIWPVLQAQPPTGGFFRDGRALAW